MTRVALLWHMHQPYYEDLVTQEHILPWVRLHALKDYYGMAALLDEFPDVRVTFNLVPSLLVQLEAFAADRAEDRFLRLGSKPADALTPEEVQFILLNFFHAQRSRMIEIYPRYAELLARRGPVLDAVQIESAARRFTSGDLRDLQVWQKLAWIDPFYLERDPIVRGLVAKGRDFTEEDKAVLRTVELELLNAVIPKYRALASKGQIEISASPFYHPILPLLCDTDIYRQTHPLSRMPRHRFIHPEDALEQLERAATCHERLFGARPQGLWPSEGSVSDAMIPLVAKAGFKWIATDELILARTVGTTFRRDPHGHVDQPRRLYQPYRVLVGEAAVACGFRDHALSDLIGFSYAGWGAEAAAEDFVSRLVEGGRRAAAQGGEEPTIFIILDGENAWEHFEGGGRPFLRALYGKLSGHAELRTVTMTDGCRPAVDTLSGIFPGSWIDANFYIWIGHQDDQRGWSQLAEARDAFASTGDVSEESVARAREELLIAQGSDWFWWYGDDHSSDHDAEFDDLFRRHLRNVYRLLRKPIPDELFVTNISGGVAGPCQTEPTGWITPVVDGEESSYFEWLGAGAIEVRTAAGAMHQSDRPAAIVMRAFFGFDRERLCLRIDTARPAHDLMAEGHRLVLMFLNPPQRQVVVCGTTRGAEMTLSMRPDPTHQFVPLPSSGMAAAGTIFELSVPLDELRIGIDESIAFFVAIQDLNGIEIERHPAGRPVEVAAQDPAFAARNWTA